MMMNPMMMNMNMNIINPMEMNIMNPTNNINQNLLLKKKKKKKKI